MSVDESVPQRPVLVAVEDQDSYQAVTWAARAAARAGLGLLVLHVYPSVTSFAGGYGYSLPVPDMQAMQDRITKKANATLEDAVALVLGQYPDLQVTTSLVRGAAPAALVTASHESSMLVVGKRSNRHPLTVGSVSLTVASHAACPVVVVPPEAPRPDHQICTPFEPACEFRHDTRRIGEVALHQQHGITTRIPRVGRHMPDERVEGTGVADTRGTSQHGNRHRVRVLFRHLRRFVGARIIVHDDLVLARKLREHGTDPPKQDANGGDLIVCGNGEVEHRTW